MSHFLKTGTIRFKQLHDVVLLAQKDVCAKVKKTAEVIEILERLPDKKMMSP